MDTQKHNLSGSTGGIFISQKGIPYFTINPRHKAYRTLSLTSDFVRFVVNCNDLPLNTARSDFNQADSKFKTFESLLLDSVNWIKGTPEYKDFMKVQRLLAKN